MIDAAQQQWALENGEVSTAVPQATDLQPYIGRGSGELPVCPLDTHVPPSFTTSYNVMNCETTPVCLIVPGTHVLN
jgi:hypothetical protein